MIDIALEYRNLCNTPSDIHEHLPTIARFADNKVVIELGVRSGVSSVAFLYADAELWSCDISPQPFVYEGWTFVQGDDMSVETMMALPERCDVLFIDTSHGYQHTVAELAVYGPRVRAGGVILLHDTELEQPEGVGEQPPFPVKKAIETYVRQRGYKWDNYENCYGLGVIHVT